MGTTFTRRSFVKTAVALGAAIVTASGTHRLVEADGAYADPDTDTSAVTIVPTVCRACIAQCTVLASVRDGRVINLEGNPEGPMSQGAMCAKGLSGIQALYNPNRNKYPMVRVGERGGNEWKRLSWDDATDQIADKLMDAYNKYGPEAVFASTGGGGNPHISGPIRFMNSFGSPNNFEPGCAQCYLPRQTQARLVFGGGKDDNLSIADSNVLEFYFTDSQVQSCVLWGAGPSWSGPSMTGRAMAALRDRDQGLKTVVIDPRFTADASKADVWLPLRPGTDVALMMCWIKYIIDNVLYDADFDQKWTNLPFLVDPDTKYCLHADVIGGSSDDYVVWDDNTGSVQALPFPYDDALDAALFGTYEVNGKQCPTGYQVLKDACDEYTLDKAAEICWLDADRIEQAIHIYADAEYSTLIHGLATDQFPNSAQAALAALELECMMGHIEKPGAALQRFGCFAEENGKGAGIIPNDTFGMGCLQALITYDMLEKRLGSNEHKGFLNWQMAHIPTVLEAITTGKPYKPRIWLERSGNKLAAVGNAKSWYNALPEIDLVVHSYMYPTSFTIEAADYILPMREWLECPKPVLLMNKVFPRQEVTHLWETCDETLMWSRLAAKCAERGHDGCRRAFIKSEVAPGKSKKIGNFEVGIEDGYPWAHSEDELVGLFYNECGDYNPDIPTFDDLVEKYAETGYEWATIDEWRQYGFYKATDPSTGKPHGFGTVSGRVEPYSEITTRLGRTGFPFALCEDGCVEDLTPSSVDYEPVPYYMEPYENPADGSDYPLVMTEGRVPIYHHGTLRNVPYLREIMPTAEIWVNPKDADEYGIADGKWVKVSSRRGETYARAVVTSGICTGAVYQERFWNPELLDKNTGKNLNGSWMAENVNVLTKNDAPFSDVYGTYTLRGFQVKVEQVDGNPYDVWTEPTDFQPWMPLTGDDIAPTVEEADPWASIPSEEAE